MAAASCLLTEDQFLCSICLDVFTDPVSTPCGHNFCKDCIMKHWSINVQCQCPVCKKIFYTRPELQINTFISEMAAQFRQSAQQETSSSSSSKQHVVKPGEVPCDVCTGTKRKALKSFLVCLASHCETHLTTSRLKRHQLMDPVENLEERMCENHNNLLELFCKTDQMFVCMLCTILDHKSHDVVPLKEEYEGKKKEIQQMILERQLKIEEIKVSVELSKKDADREIEEGVQVFTALKESVDRVQAELIETIKEKQRTTEKQAEDLITELEQELSDLKKRSSEVEQLSESEDHLRLLQNFLSLNTAPPTKDWTEVRIRAPVYLGTVSRAVVQLEKMLSEQITVFEDALKRVRHYEVDVTIDPDIVDPLVPSQWCRCASSKRSFSSKKVYFEVQVKKLSTWTLGVTRTSHTLETEVMLSPRNSYWTVCCNQNEYYAAADPPVHLSVKSPPKKVGVFVDYEERLVSFYDAGTAARIYCFTGCSFTGKLYPFFSLCPNDGVRGSGWSAFLTKHKLCLR